MQQYIIQQNKHDQLTIKWDDERIALISRGRWGNTKTIILNPKEAHTAANFIRRYVPVS